MGDKYGRVEECIDPSMKLQGLMVVSEPKLWIINLLNKTGRLIVDPGPTFIFRSPILPSPGRAQTPSLPDFEFGKEYDFLKANKAVKSNVEIDGKKYDSLSLLKDGYEIVLLSRPGTETPIRVKVQKDQAVICEFIYDEY
jgi:hypothetical protein